jgi:hypothetical protein
LPYQKEDTMMARGSLLLLMFALAAGMDTAQAQSVSSPYRFIDRTQSAGLWAGYVSTGRGTVELGPESGPVIGGRYTIRLSGPFTVEAEAGYFNSTRTVLDTATVGTARGLAQVGDADLTLLTLNASLRFNLTGPRTWHGIQPFVAFGAGTALDLSGNSATDADVVSDARFDFGTSFAGQLGGGIEWFPSDRLSLRVDARNVLWKLKTPVPFVVIDPTGRTPESEWIQNGFFTVGIALHF